MPEFNDRRPRPELRNPHGPSPNGSFNQHSVAKNPFTGEKHTLISNIGYTHASFKEGGGKTGGVKWHSSKEAAQRREGAKVVRVQASKKSLLPPDHPAWRP